MVARQLGGGCPCTAPASSRRRRRGLGGVLTSSTLMLLGLQATWSLADPSSSSAAVMETPPPMSLHLMDHSAKATALCDKGLMMCRIGVNVVFWVKSPSPFDMVIGGANFSINDGPEQVGDAILSSHQWENHELGGVEACDGRASSRWCQRYTWSALKTYHLQEALPHRLCFTLWAADLATHTTAEVPEPTCVHVTTPHHPDKREHIHGPASAFLLTEPYNPTTPIRLYPLLPPAFTAKAPAPPPPLQLHDSWSAQTLCVEGSCRSYVHAPIVVIPSSPLAPVAMNGYYQLSYEEEDIIDGDMTVGSSAQPWAVGGLASSQGMSVMVDERWGQLWSWDLALKHAPSHKPTSICLQLASQDQLTLSTATSPLDQGPWCFHFTDLDSMAPAYMGSYIDSSTTSGVGVVRGGSNERRPSTSTNSANAGAATMVRRGRDLSRDVPAVVDSVMQEHGAWVVGGGMGFFVLVLLGLGLIDRMRRRIEAEQLAVRPVQGEREMIRRCRSAGSAAGGVGAA